MEKNRTPPTIEAFNQQVVALVEQLGAVAFCAPEGQQPEHTLFVEEHSVVAEPRGAPRHPYGLYCQVAAGLSDDEMAERLYNWLESGEAYQEFLAMNVCRYNC